MGKIGEVIAHRGLTGGFALPGEGPSEENTLTAFRQAIALGVDAIELDLHMTKDGQIVVIHDEELDRTTTGSGLVKEHTLEELKRCWIKRANGLFLRGERIPTYEEVLDLYQDVSSFRGRRPFIHAELKTERFPYEGIEKKVLQLAADRGLHQHVKYSSFHHQSMRNVFQEAGGEVVQTALLFHYNREPRFPADFSMQKMNEMGATAIHPHVQCFLDSAGHLDTRAIQQVQAQGIQVRCYTVNDNLDLGEALLRLGVDVFTDQPDRLLERKRALQG